MSWDDIVTGVCLAFLAFVVTTGGFRLVSAVEDISDSLRSIAVALKVRAAEIPGQRKESP